MKETLSRSILKSLFFFVIKIGIAYFILRDIQTSIYLNVLILMAYFGNERLWAWIKWGYKKEKYEKKNNR